MRSMDRGCVVADLVSRLQAAQLRGNADPADVGAGGLLDEAAKRIAELERRIIALETRFIHYHENNGVDDICDKCGLDLFDKVHVRRKESSRD